MRFCLTLSLFLLIPSPGALAQGSSCGPELADLQAQSDAYAATLTDQDEAEDFATARRAVIEACETNGYIVDNVPNLRQLPFEFAALNIVQVYIHAPALTDITVLTTQPDLFWVALNIAPTAQTLETFYQIEDLETLTLIHLPEEDVLDFNRLPRLKYLTLAGASQPYIEAVGRATHLRHLTLFAPAAQDYSPLGSIENLKKLVLHNAFPFGAEVTPIDNLDLSFLSQYQALYSLGLSGISDDDVPHITALENLWELKLHKATLSDLRIASSLHRDGKLTIYTSQLETFDGLDGLDLSYLNIIDTEIGEDVEGLHDLNSIGLFGLKNPTIGAEALKRMEEIAVEKGFFVGPLADDGMPF